MRTLSEIVPVIFAQFDLVVLRRLFDVCERQFAIFVAHALYLVEACHCVSHVRGIGKRLLSLLRKRIRGIRELVTVGSVEVAVRFVDLPCCSWHEMTSIRMNTHPNVYRPRCL